MKRTAKWMKHLTIKELKHMRDSNAPSLRMFVQQRIHQKRMKAERLASDPDLPMGIAEPCFECRSIEHKLREAGVLSKIG